jgi:two-component system heavy metal sensor histidine kinase CusS
MKRSLTRRLLGFFSIVTLSVLIVLGTLLAQAIERHFEEMDLSELQNKHQQIQYRIQHDRLAQDPVQLTAQLEHLLPHQAGWQFIVLDLNHRPYYASDPALYDFDWQAVTANTLFSVTIDTQHYRSWMPPNPSTRPWRILALLNVDHHDHFMHYFLQILWAGLVLAILLISGLGWLVIRQALQPLNRLSDLAAKVSSEHLGERLDLSNLPIELKELAGVLNAMLNRLEASFQRLSQFSADIAHELRTPINTLLTQSQVALSKARSVEEYQDILASNIEELERLGSTIRDMLFLAKADKGALIPETQTVDLAKEAQRIIDYYQLLASEHHIHIALSGHACVRGDAILLGRALANLLSNAIRYANEGSKVTVSLSQTADHTLIEVTNQGPQIPAQHRPHLFDRFYRVESARSYEGGTGLGLAITRSIVEAHQGQIELCDHPEHTCFRITLPGPEPL